MSHDGNRELSDEMLREEDADSLALLLAEIRVPVEKDFSTYEFLGNMGTVSLPLTAAIAEEREFLKSGDRVGFLGIGSGLNCLMAGLRW